MALRVLVVAAHPDDETYGLGGTIARHIAQGDLVSVLILADGVTARHNATEQQKAAALKACDQLGVDDIHFAGLADQRLDAMPLLDVIQPIQEAIRDSQPSTVYTHHGGDVNQDHRMAFEATLVAVRPFDANPVNRVLCYDMASSTEWGPPFEGWAFLPNIFINIGETLETKLRAIEAYRDTFQSEVKAYPHPRSPEAVRIYAQRCGIGVGFEYAEAFMLIRELM